MSESESVKLPEIPGELWMLVLAGVPTVWVEAKDVGGEACGRLVFFSEQEASDAVLRLSDVCDILCRPVRVK